MRLILKEFLIKIQESKDDLESDNDLELNNNNSQKPRKTIIEKMKGKVNLNSKKIICNIIQIW